MANITELEDVGGGILNVDVEISHLRAFQTGQPSPSDVLVVTSPFDISLEIEFGGTAAAGWMGALRFTVKYFFDLIGPGSDPAGPFTVGPVVTVFGTSNYSGLSATSTKVNIPNPGLAGFVAGSLYKVGAIVSIDNAAGTTLYQGFLEGLVIDVRA